MSKSDISFQLFVVITRSTKVKVQRPEIKEYGATNKWAQVRIQREDSRDMGDTSQLKG